MVFVVSYDLVGSYRDPDEYSSLEAQIKALSTDWFHFQKSEWLIASPHSAVAIRDSLLGFIRQGDRLMVNRVTSEWAAYALTDAESAWLNRQNYADTGVPLLGLPRFR